MNEVGTMAEPESKIIDDKIDDQVDEEVIDIDDELLKDEEGNDDDNDPTSSSSVSSPTPKKIRSNYTEFSTKFTDENTSSNTQNLQPGIPTGFFIIHHTTIPHNGFTQSQITQAFTPQDIERLKLQPNNVTVPAALLMLYPEQFTTQTRARKDTRRKKVLVHRGPLVEDKDGNMVFNRAKFSLAKVIDRV